MFVVIGSVTADLLVQSDASLPGWSGDGFRSSNLIFTQAPLTITMGGNGGNSAYVLYGLQQGWPHRRALRFGNAVAAMVVAGKRGILDSPSPAQVEAFLDANR